MSKKLFFYDRHGVEAYYIYDPDKNDLSGLLRSEGNLEVIDSMNNWVSPRLGIRFDMSGQELQLYYPSGEIFQSLEQTKSALKEEQKPSQLLAEKLRKMGINPDELR